MAESSPAGYVFEQNAADRERLRLASGPLNALTSEVCLRAGIRRGSRAIDVGCGQLGALPVLAELVGPTGVVVGLDRSTDALAAARESVATMGLNAVHLVAADIKTLDPSALADWMPFDLAVCRLLLTHQRDPVATLRAVAWEYGDVFPAAGLRLLEWRGELSLFKDDTTFLKIVRELLPAQKTGLLAAGLTTEEEIDRLTAEMDAAIAHPPRRAASMILVDAIAEVPS